MRYYVSKCHNKLNGELYSPELINNNVCVNPYYRVSVSKLVQTNILIDSGAFQDVGNDSRLDFDKALQRQMDFEKALGIRAEAIVSYDRLVDEQLDQVNGQIKKRVSSKKATDYVEETIEAAQFLSKQRARLEGRRLVLSCQGVTPSQYLRCVDSVLSYATEDDIIGFGGFCILSTSNKIEQDYYKVIEKAIPKIVEAGLSRVHIFGLGMFRPLIQTDIYCRMHGVNASYDTSSPELNATFGRVFNPTGPTLSCVYEKIHKKNGYHPATLAEFNIKMIKMFWEEHMKLALPEKFVPQLDLADRKRKREQSAARAAAKRAKSESQQKRI